MKTPGRKKKEEESGRESSRVRCGVEHPGKAACRGTQVRRYKQAPPWRHWCGSGTSGSDANRAQRGNQDGKESGHSAKESAGQAAGREAGPQRAAE